MSKEDTLKSLESSIEILGDKNILKREESYTKLCSIIIPQIVESNNQDAISEAFLIFKSSSLKMVYSEKWEQRLGAINSMIILSKFHAQLA